MATVTGYTAARMQEIEDGTVVGGEVVGDDLVLTRRDGGTINAGDVRGPQGPQGPSGGVTDHGALTGLEDDDHPQYLTEDRADALYATLGSGVTDHGALTGLADDDHPQYSRIATGTYNGNDAASRTIVLPFTPTLVIVSVPTLTDMLFITDVLGVAGNGMILQGGGSADADADIALATNGFIVTDGGVGYNVSGFTYKYVAFKQER